MTSVRGGLPQAIRDGVLLVAGVVGVGHETLMTDEPRLPLLFLFGAMMGLPAFLGLDRFFGAPK